MFWAATTNCNPEIKKMMMELSQFGDNSIIFYKFANQEN